MDKKGGQRRGKTLTMPSVIFKNFKIVRTVSVSQTYSEAHVEAVQRGALRCTTCGSEHLIHYDSYERQIKHISDNGAKYLLVVKCQRYKCKHCGKVFSRDDKRLVYADNPNVEVYEKQLNNRRLPQENETDTTNGLRLSKLPKLQIEGLGSMRHLSLKSTLFGVDPNRNPPSGTKACFATFAFNPHWSSRLLLVATKKPHWCGAFLVDQ